MAEDFNKIDYVERRLNSLLNNILEGTKGVGNTQSHNVEHYSTKEFIELHKKIKEMFPENNFLPNPMTIEEINKEYQYGQGYYVKTKIREIAAALGITLEVDKRSNSAPIMAQYQTQSLTQLNLQNVNNVIECVNSLQLEWEKKEEIVKLVREFDEASKKKEENKLKSIFKKIAEISPQAAGFILQYAKELGLTSLLFG